MLQQGLFCAWPYGQEKGRKKQRTNKYWLSRAHRKCALLERDYMKKDIILTLIGIGIILGIGCMVFLIPYGKAAKRNDYERLLIEEYLNEQQEDNHPGKEAADMDERKEPVIYDFSDVDTSAYKGKIDSILIIDKINLKKAIIRGEYNDYNLDRYYFVTADQLAVLGQDNYIIYGHCSQTYGHSFNRLEELEVGDVFQLIQGANTFDYVVSNVRRELRENASQYLNTGENTVQLLSCEKKKVSGYPEKRLIIVTAKRMDKR